MSARTPVVLVALPNLPYLLGTFDTANFRNWWRSAPFPEAIAELKKGIHIYGRSHLAIARRVDGRWAVYRSKDYGINWERAWLASAGEVIYDIVLINFGWAIMNTSAGFYETQTAGTSWTKVSNLPGASVVPAFCNIGGGDVLLCTDGRYIWRSTDIARHWTLVCDQRALQRMVPGYRWITYTGLTYPCIAGANGYVICGFGPHVTISEDGGSTWTVLDHQWEYAIPGDNRFSYPNLDLIWNRFLPVEPPQFIIRQILISSIDGPRPIDVTYLLRYDDLYPLSGQSALYSRTFVSYPWADRYIAWKCIYQQYISTSEGNQLSAYDLPITGASTKDKLAFSAQTRMDASGQMLPSLKYSLDGGTTWIDINLLNIKIGDPGEAAAIAYGPLFLDDNFAKITWIHGGCDNVGYWDFVEQYRRQCLSSEMDANLAKAHRSQDTIDSIISQTKVISQQIDGLLEKTIAHPYRNDVLCEGRQAKSYQLDRQLQGKVSHESPVDVILSVDTPCPYQIDVGRIWKQPRKYYHLDALMRAIVGRNYSCDVVLVKNNLNSILSKMAGKIPQFLDLDVPEESEGAFDSKQETV